MVANLFIIVINQFQQQTQQELSVRRPFESIYILTLSSRQQGSVNPTKFQIKQGKLKN